MNTDNQSSGSKLLSMLNDFWNKIKTTRISRLRRYVLLAFIVLFLLQFLKVKVLVGSLVGSVALSFLKLIDVFAYIESLLASRTFVLSALLALLPIIAAYLIFGRVFCGWLCPMDYLFEQVDKAKKWKKSKLNISPKIGYVIAFVFLAASFVAGIPVFSNYFSHLTNFFRGATGIVFLSLDLPVEPSVIYFSLSIVLLLLVLEFFVPRLWCRVLCPVGKTYGLLNKISLLKIKYVASECAKCKLCERVCYMDVKISEHVDKKSLRDINCIYCGRCLDACNAKKKLINFSLGR